MENKFDLLRDLPEDMDINKRWTKLKEMFHEVGEKILGREKKMHATSSLDVCAYLGTRFKTVSNQLEAEYKRLDGLVKKSCRNDKRQQIEQLAKMAQDAAEMGMTDMMKTVYDITRD